MISGEHDLRGWDLEHSVRLFRMLFDAVMTIVFSSEADGCFTCIVRLSACLLMCLLIGDIVEI